MGMSVDSGGEGEAVAGDSASCLVFLVLFAGVSRDWIPWIKDGVAER